MSRSWTSNVTEDLRNQILEIAEVARSCPENLQEKCFELLLADLLDRRSGRVELTERRTSLVESGEAPDLSAPDVDGANAAPSSQQSDLTSGDVHVKVRRFLQRYNLTLEDLNLIFYKDDTEILPLYDDLRTTRMAESQIRIALLQSLRTAISSGEFEFDGEKVREECQVRKCYDGGNFAANFRNSSSLFDGFEKYDRAAATVRLSEGGRRELAELIRELG